MKFLTTFEFGLIGKVNRSLLEPYLKEVWQQRLEKEIEIGADEKEYSVSQAIISFDGDIAWAKNYIGFIQTTEEQIEIYPKVFRDYQINDQNKKLFISHFFFWFNHCRKWKFPFTKNNLNLDSTCDLPELIINVMASRMREVISEFPISLYEEVEESLIMPKGRIDFNRYISNGLTNGNHQILECDTEPLIFDNKLNRTIKYVTRLLSKKARFIETKQILNDILFILDEVEDTPSNSAILNNIKVNAHYTEYLDVIDICRSVLDLLLYDHQYYEQKNWCLLLPMEYIFEDFIAGYFELYFSKDWIVEYQKSDKFLTDESVFKMQHDIVLTHRNHSSLKIIIDTKYKIRNNESREDKKRGVMQSDLYQVTSYAFRRGCKAVLLLYPNYTEVLQHDSHFTISSGFNENDKIYVTAAEVPFWSINNFDTISHSLYEKLNKLLNHFSSC